MEYTRANNITVLFAEIEKLTLGRSVEFANKVIADVVSSVNNTSTFGRTEFGYIDFGSWGKSGASCVDYYHVYAGEVVDKFLASGCTPEITKEFHEKQLKKYVTARVLFVQAHAILIEHLDELKASLADRNFTDTAERFRVKYMIHNTENYIAELSRHIGYADKIIQFIDTLQIVIYADETAYFPGSGDYTDYEV